MFRKKLTTEFVKLKCGKVYFKEITHGMLNRITRKATMFGNTMNNPYFLELFEYALLDLPKRKIRALSLSEGNKVREKLKDILLGYGILEPDEKESPSDEANIFSPVDTQWFEESKNLMLNKRGIQSGQ